MRHHTRRIFQHMPWMDAAGRFTPMKAAAFCLCCAPAMWMATEFSLERWDLPSPYVALIYHSGLWATYLLLLSLLITPMRRVTGWGRLAQLRRMVGVSSFLYGLLHFLAWLGLRYWDWATLLNEAITRPTVWVATVSFIALFALAMTSFDVAIRLMGGALWKRLHRLVYVAAFLAVLHFLMSPGSVQGTPYLMAGAYAWLMGWRALDRRRLGTSPVGLLVVGVTAAMISLVLQPIWLATMFAERNLQNLWQAVADNVNGDVWLYLGIPPFWQLLAWTAVTTVIGRINPRRISP